MDLKAKVKRTIAELEAADNAYRAADFRNDSPDALSNFVKHKHTTEGKLEILRWILLELEKVKVTTKELAAMLLISHNTTKELQFVLGWWRYILRNLKR